MKNKNQTHLTDTELRTIIDSSFDEIFVTDGDGIVLMVNPAGESYYGIKEEDLVGKSTATLVAEGLYGPSLFPIVKERKERVSMVQRTKMGKTIHVIGNPVFDDEGNISKIIFTSRDLTEVRYLQEKIERTEELLHSYEEELEELRKTQEEPSDVIAFSPSMKKILKMIDKVAIVDSTVLITGESGVGKGLIASTIHKRSPRRDKPFIHINCGAIPETLMESELFGYEGGAFTGASKEGKPGLVEQADGGTLFLDEIGELPLNLQVKLLKTLQDRTVQRVGGTAPQTVDVRVVAATNRNLEQMVAEGRFREDLFYRLNVIPIHIPPLRARPEDIASLLNHFLNKYNQKYKRNHSFSLEAENILVHYDWPGNVREVENIVERLVVTSEANEISAHDLPDKITDNVRGNEYNVCVRDICPLKEAQEELEEQLIRKAYDMYKSSYKVAEVLGINQSTAYRKMQKYLAKKR